MNNTVIHHEQISTVILDISIYFLTIYSNSDGTKSCASFYLKDYLVLLYFITFVLCFYFQQAINNIKKKNVVIQREREREKTILQ